MSSERGQPRILAERVGKDYRHQPTGGRLRERVADRLSRDPSFTRALDGIELRIETNEMVGLIGPNGAGKSTLLKILAGVSEPTRGRARVWGRVAPLLAVGVGFNDLLTGRENLQLAGALFGCSADEIRDTEDQIVEFAGIGDAFDLPMREYSSGMKVRLGFSVAMHTDVDVLLIDEALAVGDAGFQRRCLDRLRVLHAEGATMILVSHAMSTIRDLCDRGIVLDGGNMVLDAPIDEAIDCYFDLIDDAPAASPFDVEGQRNIGGASLRDLVVDTGSEDARSLSPGARVEVTAVIGFNRAADHPAFSLALLPAAGAAWTSIHTPLGARYRQVAPGEAVTVRFGFHANVLGEYSMVIGATTSDGEQVYFQSAEMPAFRTRSESGFGSVYLDADISVDGVPCEGSPQL